MMSERCGLQAKVVRLEAQLADNSVMEDTHRAVAEDILRAIAEIKRLRAVVRKWRDDVKGGRMWRSTPRDPEELKVWTLKSPS